jgi:TPR repeat protein
LSDGPTIFDSSDYYFFLPAASFLNAGTGCSNLGFMYEEGKGVKQDDLTFASAMQIPNNRATTAKIQITRLLVKLECFEIILFNPKGVWFE